MAKLLLLLLSPAVGSWLALLADRLPRGEPTVVARSACRGCGQVLRARDLVPLLSFLALRGRCRSCGTPIPRWLPVMELAATALALLALWLGGPPGAVLLGAALLWCLLALAATDLLWLRLPDQMTLALLLLALLWSALHGAGWAQALVGAALGSGSFLLLRLGYRHLRGREGLGQGDVKLMAGIGALCGPWDLPLVVLIAALGSIAAAAALALLRGTPLRGAHALPFGTALCTAAGLVWISTRSGLLPPMSGL